YLLVGRCCHGDDQGAQHVYRPQTSARHRPRYGGGNPVFIYHDAFNPNAPEVADLKERYRAGKVGDVEVKAKLTRALNDFLEPIRERRTRYEANPGLVQDVLARGIRRMQAEAAETMGLVREATGLKYSA